LAYRDIAIDTMPRMRTTDLSERLASSLREMWSVAHRQQTLARIAAHQRQFENWWKFEMATHLWDFDEDLAAFVEGENRADIVLARTKQVSGAWVLDKGNSPHVPIELKTVGTWWGQRRSAIGKALAEPGKKRLDADMKAATQARLRADPFSVVALLITHETRLGGQVLKDYEDEALRLGSANSLPEPTILQTIELPSQFGIETTARQIVWFVPSPADSAESP
jgi:hypothetical protein